MNSIVKGINALNEQVGYWTSFLVLPLVVVVSWEVMMRYAFDAPTIWAFEMTMFLYGTHYMLGLAYAYKHDGHVCIDVVLARFSPKKQAGIRIFSHFIMFLPVIGMFAVASIIYAHTSWTVLEHNSTSWSPALYPFKTFMAIGFVMLFLQGIVKVIEDVRILRQP